MAAIEVKAPVDPPDPEPTSCDDVIRGTADDDKLFGTVGAEKILGLAGDDRIRRRAAATTASEAAPDDDYVSGGAGATIRSAATPATIGCRAARAPT